MILLCLIIIEMSTQTLIGRKDISDKIKYYGKKI
jgi:hypothetical protein